jgi:lipopolysaccharide/colanic/teichoic acid biosynthesis glycosyltransferase
MTIAEMTETQYLTRLARLDVAQNGDPAQAVLEESSFFPRKQLLDRVVGVLLLIPALPVIGLLILAVRLTSRGPGVFSQLRVGKKGRVFTMYKLRSMRTDAETATGPAWSPSGDDPRVTWLGYWLRRLHLDELPQLFNVVRGEMSLVGPRPERPEFVSLLADEIPGYLNRLMVEPGITGLAQINLPPDTDLDSVRRKLMLDCDYIRTASLWIDVRILTCTLLRMAWIKGPRVTRQLGLERVVHLAPKDASHGDDQRAAAPVSLSELAKSNGRDSLRRDDAPPRLKADHAQVVLGGARTRPSPHERHE